MRVSLTGYTPRHPGNTVLHQTIRKYADEFFGATEDAGVPLPRTIRKEFAAFLGCGDLRRGFLRAECNRCRGGLLIPFSCKRRTCCPSCGAKRAAEMGAQLVDAVIPNVAVRHWVLSLPFDVRYPLMKDRTLLSACLRLFIDVVGRLYTGGDNALKFGAVAGIHRADSALRVNPDFHVLFLDGSFKTDDEEAVFVRGGPLAEERLCEVSKQVATRIRKLFVRRKLVDFQGEPTEDFKRPPHDDIRFGVVNSEGDVAVLPEGGEVRQRASSAEVMGFSVFCGRPEARREEIERLCRYIARPPVAHEQLSQTADGHVAVELKRANARGATHVFMNPLVFLRRLASLVPPAGMNLLRYFGILGPAARHRHLVVPRSGGATAGDDDSQSEGRNRSPYDWAMLLKGLYAIDVLACPCGGRLRIVAAIEQPEVVDRILGHLEMDSAPAQAPPCLAA